MKSFLENIKIELTKQVDAFELANGNLEDYFSKQIALSLHKMYLDDIFLDPDLVGLENYEKDLND